MKPSKRADAIIVELDRCANEYVETKERHEEAQVAFDTAREKFGSVKRLASEMLSENDWRKWQNDHRNLQYVAMPIGDAIRSVLNSKAYLVAVMFVKKRKEEFAPAMNLYEIGDALDEGGFAFRTPTPVREVNAALIHLKGITTLENGAYQVEDTEKILKDMKDVFAEPDKDAEKEK